MHYTNFIPIKNDAKTIFSFQALNPWDALFFKLYETSVRNLLRNQVPEWSSRIVQCMCAYYLWPGEFMTFVGGDIVFLIFNFHFVAVYLICFYMWLSVLTSRNAAIYSDGDNIIIIIIYYYYFVFVLIFFFCLRLVFYVGYVGITLVALVFRWLLSPPSMLMENKGGGEERRRR